MRYSAASLDEEVRRSHLQGVIEFTIDCQDPRALIELKWRDEEDVLLYTKIGTRCKVKDKGFA